MLLKDFLPPIELSSYVQTYRIVHFRFDEHQILPSKAYPPKPENCLMFFLKKPDMVQFSGAKQKISCPNIVLTGQQTSVATRFPSQDFLNFQIVFQPTGIYRLLGIPATELTDCYVDAETVFSNEIKQLHEQLQYATDYQQMLVLANGFVNDLVKKSKQSTGRIDKTSQLILRAGGNVSLDWLAEEACLSVKQFRRKFVEQVGVNPQYYARIVRFTKAYNLHNKMPQLDWLSIALQTGYYDYQHLTKDYQEFTKSTPIEFHLLESRSPERVLGIADAVYQSR